MVVALTPISKTPNMLSPMASIRPSRQKFTQGFSNQKAQFTTPSAPWPSQNSLLKMPGPAGAPQSNMFAFSAIRMAVMIQKEIRMPSTKVREWASTFFRSPPPSWTKLMILRPITGKTHGMTFRMMPPMNMKNMISPSPISGGAGTGPEDAGRLPRLLPPPALPRKRGGCPP